MDSKNGAFIYKENDELLFFLYKMHNEIDLVLSIPKNYKNQDEDICLTLSIDSDNRHETGQMVITDIQEIININNMKNIFNDYSELKDIFNELTFDKYNEYQRIANLHF